MQTSGKTRKTLFFTMIMHPVTGWTRVGNAYGSRRAAADWVPFVRRAWRGLHGRVAQCTVHFANGQLTERSKRILDQKFNLDA